MVAAVRKLPFECRPCIAHILQRTVTVCLDDSMLGDALAKCCKIAGHFKQNPANTEKVRQQQTELGLQIEHLIQYVLNMIAMISCLLKNQEAVNATLG